MIACHSAKVITYETMLYGGGGRGRSGVDAQLVEDVADAFARVTGAAAELDARAVAVLNRVSACVIPPRSGASQCPDLPRSGWSRSVERVLLTCGLRLSRMPRGAGYSTVEARSSVVARAIWTEPVSFGLVNVTVGLCSATKDYEVHFHKFRNGTGRSAASAHADDEIV
jgi:hypothetical protein